MQDIMCQIVDIHRPMLLIIGRKLLGYVEVIQWSMYGLGLPVSLSQIPYVGCCMLYSTAADGI